MLPSKGYFSGIPCVFFSDGGCHRPHCHYRHSYQDVVSGDVGPKAQNQKPMSTPTLESSESSGLGTAVKIWSPSQVNLVTHLVENAVDEALRSDLTTTEMPRSTLAKNTLDSEALKMASNRKFRLPPESVPSYRPTPISKLTTRHIPVPCAPVKPYSPQVKILSRGNCAYSTKNNSLHHKPIKTAQSQTSDGLDFELETCVSVNTLINIPCSSLKASTSKELGHFSKSNQTANSQKEPNLIENCGNDSKTHQNSIQLENAALPCRIPLNSLVGVDLVNNGDRNISRVSCRDDTNSKKKFKLSHKVSPGKLFSSGFTKKDSSEAPTQYETKTSVANADESALKGAPIELLEDHKIQHEPPAKKTKFDSVTLKVTCSTDPFSRWMKNNKIRQILGRDKKHESSGKKPTFPGCTLFQAHRQLPSPKTNALPLKEELPEPKTAKRVAHKKYHFTPVPISAEEVKIPSTFRHHFCSAFFEEFKKTMNLEDAKRKSEQEELQIAKSSKIAITYKNNCSLLILKFRRGVGGVSLIPEDLTPASCPDFTYGWSLYQSFSSYLLSEDELSDNGFPLAVPNKPNCAYVDKSARRFSPQQPEKPFQKICALCSVDFQIDPSGMPTTKDDCFYHWGKLRKVQYKGQMVDKFTCCGGGVDSAPCEFSSYHVWSGQNEDCMEDFMETKKLPSRLEDHEAGIYALDCEMCYTTKGLELARLTVLGLNGQTVYDQVIITKNPILNYCTQFSGIDARKMASATHTFDDVRRWVVEHFYDKTILVGHSLENDLKALKLIHRTIVDTSVTFPHKYGPPHKMSLKHLANVVLELNIQENVDGHDSKEDAATCLKLMMKKIQEDSKARKPRVIIGYHGKKK